MPSFWKEISFVFQPCCEKPMEGEGKTDLSADEQLRLSVQETRDKLKDPAFYASLEEVIPKVDGMDLAQRISFKIIMEEFNARFPGAHEYLIDSFQRRIKESLRCI
jgi:hypothetical protein